MSHSWAEPSNPPLRVITPRRVIIEEPAEARPPTNPADDADRWRTRDQFVLNPLMIALPVVVLDVLGKRPPEMAFAKRITRLRHSSLIEQSVRRIRPRRRARRMRFSSIRYATLAYRSSAHQPATAITKSRTAVTSTTAGVYLTR